jgi:hypothetical protein
MLAQITGIFWLNLPTHATGAAGLNRLALPCGSLANTPFARLAWLRQVPHPVFGRPAIGNDQRFVRSRLVVITTLKLTR